VATLFCVGLVTVLPVTATPSTQCPRRARRSRVKHDSKGFLLALFLVTWIHLMRR
jgi:hypothetical protein